MSRLLHGSPVTRLHGFKVPRLSRELLLPNLQSFEMRFKKVSIWSWHFLRYYWSLVVILILILMFTFLVLSCRASRSWCMRIGITTLTFLWDYEKYQAVFGFVFFNFLSDIEKYQVVFGFVSFNFLWDFEKYHVVFAFVFAEQIQVFVDKDQIPKRLVDGQVICRSIRIFIQRAKL